MNDDTKPNGSDEFNPKDLEIWEQIVNSYRSLRFAMSEFSQENVNRVALIRRALQPLSQRREHNEAIYALVGLEEDELKDVFDLLIYWASWQNGQVDGARTAIHRISKEWLLEHLDTATESYMHPDDPDAPEAYQRFLELYYEIDPVLTKRLALRATTQENLFIQNIGKEFLAKLA